MFTAGCNNLNNLQNKHENKLKQQKNQDIILIYDFHMVSIKKYCNIFTMDRHILIQKYK